MIIMECLSIMDHSPIPYSTKHQYEMVKWSISLCFVAKNARDAESQSCCMGCQNQPDGTNLTVLIHSVGKWISIVYGWWYTYRLSTPLKKNISQLGWFFPIYGTIKAMFQTTFQTTNQIYFVWPGLSPLLDLTVDSAWDTERFPWHWASYWWRSSWKEWMEDHCPVIYIYMEYLRYSPLTNMGLYWIIWVVSCYIRIITYFKPLHPDERLWTFRDATSDGYPKTPWRFLATRTSSNWMGGCGTFSDQANSIPQIWGWKREDLRNDETSAGSVRVPLFFALAQFGRCIYIYRLF